MSSCQQPDINDRSPLEPAPDQSSGPSDGSLLCGWAYLKKHSARIRAGMGIGLVPLIAVLPIFLDDYYINVFISVGLYALLSLSLNVILGHCGMFHMGHAAFYAIGAYTTAVLNTQFGIPILAILPIAGLAAALFALIVAAPIIHLRGDYLLLVTIGIVEIVRIALTNDVGGVTGGSNGIIGMDSPNLFGYVFNSSLAQHYLVWVIVAASLYLFHLLANSRFGRALNYIKSDETAAQGCGINTGYYKLIAFVIGAFWAGLAGNLFASLMGVVTPNSFNFMESVIVFAIVIIAGGSQVGVILGTIVFIALPEVFRWAGQFRMLFFGLAMMVMMIVRPQGIFPPAPRFYHVVKDKLKTLLADKTS